MKKFLDWNPDKDIFTKSTEISLHEKIHEEKFNLNNFLINDSRLKYLLKAENLIGKKITGNILEIGAGNGYMSIYIAKNREINQIYVMECTRNEVDKLIRKNFEKNKIENNKYELVLGSFNAIPLKEKFDFVISFGTLHHSSNLQKTLDEIHKSLKCGGYLIAQEPYSLDSTQNSIFIKRKDKVENVQGLIKIKNSLRDDNFFRKCEYLTASFHAGYENVRFERLKKSFKNRLSTILKRQKSKNYNMLLILKKGPKTKIHPPHRWLNNPF